MFLWKTLTGLTCAINQTMKTTKMKREVSRKACWRRSQVHQIQIGVEGGGFRYDCLMLEAVKI